MRVSLFTVILTVAASVNAAAIQERDISTGVQSCIKDLNVVNFQVLEATDTINQYNNTIPYLHAVRIALAGQRLTGNLTLATTSCGALTSSVTKEESTAVLNVVGSIIPNAETMYSTLLVKKTEFDVTPLVIPLVKAHFTNVTNGFAALDSRLVALTPSEDGAAINAYVNRISSAYTSFKTAYGVA